MKKQGLVTIGLITLAIFPHSKNILADGINRAFPQQMVYSVGTIKPNTKAQAAMNTDVINFYNQWKTDYLVDMGLNSAGKKLYRISYIKKTDPNYTERTVSEGQGYGMVITALMAGADPNAKSIFDGLYRFSRQYPSTHNNKMMDWEWTNPNIPDSSAFDGDADIAFSLLIANAQWGRNSEYNYSNEARAILGTFIKQPYPTVAPFPVIGSNSYLPILGDYPLFNRASTYGENSEYSTRPSDFMLSHFRSFRRFMGDARWDTVVTRCQNVITSMQTNYSPLTGLIPDFVVSADTVPQPAPVGFLEGGLYSNHYDWNSGRVPWRLGLDVLLNDNATTKTQVQKISNWIKVKTSGIASNVLPGYKLNGDQLKPDVWFSSFFTSPFGVSAMTVPAHQAWLNSVYNKVYNHHEDYYSDSVTLLSLLAMTGNYWEPVSLMENSGFEINSVNWSRSISNWQQWDSPATTSSSAYVESTGGSYEGNFHLKHWKATPYQVYTYQLNQGLRNGKYTLRATVRGGGSHVGSSLNAQNYGGTALGYNLTSSMDGIYRTVEINNIQVTNNQLEAGLWTNANGNAWMEIDSVELFRTGN